MIKSRWETTAFLFLDVVDTGRDTLVEGFVGVVVAEFDEGAAAGA